MRLDEGAGRGLRGFFGCCCMTFAWGLAAHGYMYLNNSISHDSLNEYIAEAAAMEWKAGLGRIFVPAYGQLLRGTTTLPWLIGLLSLLYIAAAAWLILRLFKVEAALPRLLICGALCVNVTVIAITATYINDLDCDMLGVLLATVSAWLWREKRLGWLWGMVPLMFSLGFYQCCISVTITLAMLCCILDLAEGRPAGEVFRDGLRAVAMLIGGGLLYLLALWLFYSFTDVQLLTDEYNSLTTIFKFGLGRIPQFIYWGWLGTVKEIFLKSKLFPAWFSALLHFGLAGLAGAGLLLRLREERPRAAALALMALLLLLLPTGMNISRVLTGNLSHDLMHYALWLTYVFALVLVWRCWRQPAARYAAAALVCVILLGGVRTANTAYIVKDFEKDANLSLFTRIAADIAEVEGYEPGETPLAFVGKPSTTLKEAEGYGRIYEITGMDQGSFVLGSGTQGGYENYFEYVLLTPAAIADDETVKAYRESEYVQAMPAYPAEGSIELIDGCLVVKLG